MRGIAPTLDPHLSRVRALCWHSRALLQATPENQIPVSTPPKLAQF